MSLPKVFISYNRNDSDWLHRLVRFLKPRQRKEEVEIWWDQSKVRPGDDWPAVMAEALETAHLGVLLLTQDFFNSDYIQNVELPRLLERRHTHGLRLAPLLVKTCTWEAEEWLRSTQFLLGNSIPLDGRQPHEIEAELKRAANEIVGLAREAVLPDPPPPEKTGDTAVDDGGPNAGKTVTRKQITAIIPPGPPDPLDGARMAAGTAYEVQGRDEQTGLPRLVRRRDGAVAALVAWPGSGEGAFLVDLQTVTTSQYCAHLNDLVDLGRARAEPVPELAAWKCVAAHDGALLAKEPGAWWRSPSARRVYNLPARPWGMEFTRGEWRPLPGSAALPATLVTWRGAVLYGRWAHGLDVDEEALRLPTAGQWQTAGFFDTARGELRRFPWGAEWQPGRAWCGAGAADGRDPPRPVDSGSFANGASPAGCLHAVGNVAQWCVQGATDHSTLAAGGFCGTACGECTVDALLPWRGERASPYVGFRCACTVGGG